MKHVEGSHATVFLAFLASIDDHVHESTAQGARPLLDAVETVRLLRALLEHRPVHAPLLVHREPQRNGSILTPAWSWNQQREGGQ